MVSVDSEDSILFKIGFVELAPITSGGAATYDRALQQTLKILGNELGFEVVRFVNVANARLMRHEASGAIGYRKSDNAQSSLVNRLARRLGVGRQDKVPSLAQALRNQRIDLAWFPSPNRVISTVRDTPFIMTVWDLGHRDVQGFPEFSQGRNWAHREVGYAENIGRAFHVVTDSIRTGKSLEQIYGLYSHNWSSAGLPLPTEIAPDYAVANKIDVPYFYYPASYWPHKNHRILIDALEQMKDSDVQLVFSGHDEGQRTVLERIAKNSSVADRINFFGRLSDAEVQGLIDSSVAIVMPTLLGPTNYPPLEALRLGKPAIVSHVHEYDQAPKSGLITVSGFDSSAWAREMQNVLHGSVHNDPPVFELADSENVLRAVLEKYRQVNYARGN